MLDIQGTSVPVCNICAPEKVEVPIELKNEEEMLISTGTFKATLDWRQKNVVVGTDQQWRRPSAWRKLRDWAHSLIHPPEVS